VIGPLDWSRSELRRGQLDIIWANLMAVDVKLSEYKIVCTPRRQDRCITPRIFDVSTRWGEQLWTPVTLPPGKGRCSHFTGGWGWVGFRASLNFLEKRKISGTYGQSSQITRPPYRGFLCQVRTPPGSTLLNCALCLDTVSYIPPLFAFNTLTDYTSDEVTLHTVWTPSVRRAPKSLLHSLLMTDAHSDVTWSLLVLKTGEKIESRMDGLACWG
jgi:hypothetical protein